MDTGASTESAKDEATTTWLEALALKEITALQMGFDNELILAR